VKLALGLVLALLSTGALNWGFLAQHGAVAPMPPLSPRRPLRSIGLLLRNRRWVAGLFAGIAGWVLYVAALALAPLSLVQASSAGGVGLLALLVTRGGGRFGRRERVAVGAAVLGLLLLGISLAGGSTAGHVPSAYAVAGWLGVSGILAALAGGPAARLLAPGAGLGMAAGLLYASGDVATKAAVNGGVWLLAGAADIAAHSLGFVALQLSFQRGGPFATIGVSTLLTNALPIAAGVAIFGESLPGGILGVLRAVAFGLVVLGAAGFAIGEREREAEEPVAPTVPEWKPSTSSTPS
jgi:hypothetical protein